MFFPLSYFILFYNKCINVFFLKISHFKEGRGMIQNIIKAYSRESKIIIVSMHFFIYFYQIYND